ARAAGPRRRRLGSALRRSAKASLEFFPDLLAHGAQPPADISRRRRTRTSWRLHQEPQHDVKDDAESRRHQGEDDKYDSDEQRLDAEVLTQAGAHARDDAIGTAPQDAPRRLAHRRAIIALNRSASDHEVVDDAGARQHEKQPDQRATNLEGEEHQPQHKQHHDDGPDQANHERRPPLGSAPPRRLCAGHLPLRPNSPQLRHDLVGVEAEEPFLILADLMDVDVVEAGILIRPDLVQVALRIRSADDHPGHVIFADGRGRLFEMGGQLELLSQLARYSSIGPGLVCGLACRGLISGPAHGYLSIARLAPSARVLEKLHGLLVRLGADVAVADLSCERARFPSATGDHDRWRLRGPAVDPSIFDGVIPSAVTYGLATPQQSDQSDRLFEHLESDVWLRPVLAQDVLIQVFAGSQPQKESPWHHGGRA